MKGLALNGRIIGRDALAGLTAAIAAIPDGMASAVLAGVNPIYGLYNLMVGTPVAALFTSSVYMAVVNTSAMALVVFETLKGYSGEEQTKALVILTLLVGGGHADPGSAKTGLVGPLYLKRGHAGFSDGDRHRHHP